jgi:hypothetical protein
LKRSLLLLASLLSITLGGVFLLYNVAFASVMDPSLKGKAYWLGFVGRISGKDFLPGVLLALFILLMGFLLGLKGLGISFGLRIPIWNRARPALWVAAALMAFLLCCLAVLLS